MKRAVLLLLPLVAACEPVDACKYANMRRLLYTTTIQAADAYALSGRPVPSEVLLGRRAAAVALAALNGRCPAAVA